MQMQDWSGDPKRRRSVGISPMGLSLLFFGVPCLLEALAEAGMQSRGAEASGDRARGRRGLGEEEARLVAVLEGPLVLWLSGFGRSSGNCDYPGGIQKLGQIMVREYRIELLQHLAVLG